MKKVNVSTKYMARFAGKWVAIDYQKDRIVAVGDTLKEIGPLVSYTITGKRQVRKGPAAFKVPRKNEGPYALLSWLFLNIENTLQVQVFP